MIFDSYRVPMRPGREVLRSLYGRICAEPSTALSPEAAAAVSRSHVLSPYAFYWRNKGKTFVYHSLLLKKLYGDETLFPVMDLLSREPGERDISGLSPFKKQALFSAIPDLLSKGLLLHPDESGDISDATKREHEGTGINVLYLLITHKCNLRCAYCFFEKGRSHNQSKARTIRPPQMSPEVAAGALSLFSEISASGPDCPAIIFYGGEPLLNWDTFTHTVRMIRGGFGRAGIEIFTNGTLIDRKKAQFLKDHDVQPVVSLDGLATHHNRLRPTREGKGSFDRAMKGFRHLRNARLEPAISCVIGPHNIDDFEEIITFFKYELGAGEVRFFPIWGLPPGSSLELPARDIVNRLIETWPLLDEPGMRDNILSHYLGLILDERNSFRSCHAYGGQICVMPDGSLGPCINLAEDYLFLWGNIADEEIKERILGGALTGDFCKRSPLRRGECGRCIGLGVCGGGCAHESFIKKGAIGEKDERQCGQIPLIVKWAVEKIGETHRKAPGKSNDAVICFSGRGEKIPSDSIPLSLSPYAHCYQKSGATVLFHSLKLKKYYGDNRLLEIYNFFKNNEPATLRSAPDSLREGIEILLDEEILLPFDSNPHEFLDFIRDKAILQRPEIRILTLLIDRHRWCPERAFARFEEKCANPAPQRMTIETAGKAVALFMRLIHRDVTDPLILLHHGEALQNVDFLRDLIELIRMNGERTGRKNPIRVSLETPAANVGKEYAGILRRWGVDVTVEIRSIEHVSHRCVDRKMFEGSLRGYEYLRDEGVEPRIALPVGRHSIPMLEDLIHHMAVTLECRRIRIVMECDPEGRNPVPAQLFAKEVTSIYSKLRAYGLYEDLVLKRVRSFVEEEPLIHHCNACGVQIAVTTDGSIGSCPVMALEKRNLSGHLVENDSEILTSRAMESLCKRTPFLKTECLSCPALGICGGGCAYMAAIESGDGLCRADCIHSQYILQWLLNDCGGRMGLKMGEGFYLE